jgi:uncharacterized protein
MPKILERSRPAISILDFDPALIRERLRIALGAKGIKEAYLFGSFAEGNCTAWSDLDIVIVHETDCPFIERPLAFAEIQDLGFPVDILVYTPQEFARMQISTSPFWRTFEKQKIRLI